MFALGGAALWPLAAHAQSSDRVRRIGVLPTGYRESDPEGQARVNALRESLGKLGWTDGRNASLEVRWPGNEIDQIRAEASALAESRPDVFVVSSNTALTTLKRLNKTIPTVFVQVSDPVGGGYVESLAHPGGNATGFATLVPENFTGRQLQFLKDLIPQASRIAVTSAWAVGSLDEVTLFQPRPTILPLRTITAPNGPPCPARIFVMEMRMAAFMKDFFMRTIPPDSGWPREIFRLYKSSPAFPPANASSHTTSRRQSPAPDLTWCGSRSASRTRKI